MLNYLTKSPKVPLLIFVITVLALWMFGRFYYHPILKAAAYKGEQIALTSVGKLVTAEGIVTDTWHSKQGIRFFTVKGEKGEFGVSVFPSLGKLSSIPREGSFIKITGLLDIYRQKTQISPLSASSIENLENSPNFRKLNPYPTVAISELEKYLDKTVWLEAIQAISVNKFTSKKGRKMLRFEVTDQTGKPVQGIFFEGDWDENTFLLLSSKQQLDMLVMVSTFQGELSVQAKYVK